MPSGTRIPELDLVVPVENGATVLQESIWRLHDYATRHLTASWRITIVDTASTDATLGIARGLAASLPNVVVLHLDRPGRGHALKTAWGASDAAVLGYLDVGLATDLAALGPLVAPLLSGHSDLAIGTRLTRSSRVVRAPRRVLLSRAEQGIVRMSLGAGFSDAQCGFKAVTRRSAERLLPLVQDDDRFFDTELLVLAERSGLRIHEVPVDWKDPDDTRIDLVQTANDDLHGIGRLMRSLARQRMSLEAIAAELGRSPLTEHAGPSFARQVLRFCVVGGLSTIAFAVLYLALRPVVGAQSANFLSLLITAVANTWANRWFTFGVVGRAGAVRHQVQGLIVFGLAWGINTLSLIWLHAADPHATPVEEMVVLTSANLVGTVLRFVLLRGWVFRARRAAPAPAPPIARPEPPERTSGGRMRVTTGPMRTVQAVAPTTEQPRRMRSHDRAGMER